MKPVMPLVAWKEQYNIGVADMDSDHRELVELINARYARLLAAGSSASIPEFFAAIHERVAAHFELEEKLMRERGYDQYWAHKNDHERLLEEIVDLADDYEDAGLFNEEEISRRLTHWFVEHFKNMDVRLHKELG